MDNECPTCGEKFSSGYGVKQHHAKTHGESIAGEPIDCENCGETVRKKQNTIDKWENNFCSRDCRFEYFRGENHPDYDRTEVKCYSCGEKVEKYPRDIRRDSERYFCDMECRNEHYRNGGMPSGEESPSWEGGFDRHYGYSWEEKRVVALERDNYICRRCGDEEYLHVHHIIPKDEFDDVNDAHYIENLATLCASCHRKLENMPEDRQREILNIHDNE